MERRRNPVKPAAPGRLSSTAGAGGEPLPDLPNIGALVDGEGQITIGHIYPIRCVAIASDGHNSLAMLVRRDGETLAQLLARLDAAIALAYDGGEFTDEMNVPLPRQSPTRRR